MFDVTKFNDRMGWTIRDLASRLFEKGGDSRVGMWKTGDSSPRYDAILKLIKLGATAEELFGRESMPGGIGGRPPELFAAPEFSIHLFSSV